MSDSIICNEKICFVCNTPYNLHRHHIYGGIGRRSLSEKYGCWIYLCAYHHNMSRFGIHTDKTLDRSIKALCQEAWEKKYGGTTEDFIRIFGKSYK